MIPVIELELNEGSHFAAARQFFHSMILGSWFVNNAHEIPGLGAHFRHVIGTRDPQKRRATVLGISSMSHPTEAQSPKPWASDSIDHVTPEHEGFAIPENADFYQRYIRLFREGVYQVARTEGGDTPHERLTRIYFFGAVDFSSLSIECSSGAERLRV